jgi:exopolysaccharide biosynthesis polyprenyl glycosylphosphotransferase
MLRRQRQINTRLRKLADAVLFGVAYWLSHWLRSLPFFDPKHIVPEFRTYAWLLLIIVPAAPWILELQGFYQRPVLGPRRQTLAQLFMAAGWMSLMVITALFFAKAETIRFVPLVLVFIIVGVGFVEEEVIRWWTLSRVGRSELGKRVILVGPESSWERMEQTLNFGSMGQFQISARLDPNKSSIDSLPKLLHDHSVNAVLMTPGQRAFNEIEQAIQICELEGVEVWLLAHFFQTRISQTAVDELGGQPVLVFRSVPAESWQSLAKEVMDRAGAAVLLLLFSIILIPAAIGVYLSSGPPILFRQRRAGLNGRPFTMLKFRTMVSNAEQLKQELAVLNEMKGPVFKVTNDPRVTPVGRFLRKWSIDEFPQLWNVLRGEMSLVGPRPLPVDEVERFDDPAHRRRLSVKPGLTCLWQVSGRNNVADFKEWVRLDLEYIDNWSIWLDFRILFRTIPAVLGGAGAK